LIAPTPSGSTGPIGSSPSGTVSCPNIEDTTPAEYPEVNDVVDSMTSARRYPQYPMNGIRQSADSGGIHLVSHDYTPQAEEVYQEYSSPNRGSTNPPQRDSYGSIPEVSPMNRPNGIQGSDPGISVPARGSTGTLISRRFTLGEIINARHSHNIPSSIYEQIVREHIYAAYNVLDPIRERFPDVIITSAYRSNSSNHRTGRAIDLVVQSRSLTTHAEIAAFARDNLPVDQVFLERNTSGRTHVHLRASRGGGSPSVLTCGDPRCRSRTAGISVDYLVRRGVRRT
jgi:hypothetical protein